MLRMKNVEAEQAAADESAEQAEPGPAASAVGAKASTSVADDAVVSKASPVARRRLGVKIGVVAVAVFAAVAYSGARTSPTGVSLNATAEAKGTDVSSTTVMPVTLDADAAMRAKLVSLRAAALEFRASTGSFDGFAASGALVSSSTDTVTISLPEGNVCGFVTVFRGEQGEPQIDPSMSACSQQLVDEAGVAARVIDLVAEAYSWSVANVDVYGRRTLTGFATPAAGVTIAGVSPDGAWAQAYVEHGAACVVVTVVPQASPSDPLQPAEQVPCPPAG